MGKKPSDQAIQQRLRRSGPWGDEYGEVRIMGVVEGYVVARRPHKMPFVSHWKDFMTRFEAECSENSSS